MAWNKTGYFDKLVELLKSVGYMHFIWCKEILWGGQEKIYPIDKIWEWKNVKHRMGDLGDIFLIK